MQQRSAKVKIATHSNPHAPPTNTTSKATKTTAKANRIPEQSQYPQTAATTTVTATALGVVLLTPTQIIATINFHLALPTAHHPSKRPLAGTHAYLVRCISAPEGETTPS